MSKAQFGLAAFADDLKDDVGAGPLCFVFEEVEAAFRGMPHNFFSWHELGDPMCAAVNVFVAEFKLGACLVGVTFDLF